MMEGRAYHKLGKLRIQFGRISRHRFGCLEGHQLEATVVSRVVRYLRLSAAKTPTETTSRRHSPQRAPAYVSSIRRDMCLEVI